MKKIILHLLLFIAIIFESNAQSPVHLRKIGSYSTNVFNQGGAEISAYDEKSKRLFLVNGGTNYSDETQLYYNAAYVYKKVNSFANYRAPYWRKVSDMPYLASLYGNGTAASYVGYVPTFIGDLNDYNATIGYKSKMNGWNVTLLQNSRPSLSGMTVNF